MILREMPSVGRYERTDASRSSRPSSARVEDQRRGERLRDARHGEGRVVGHLSLGGHVGQAGGAVPDRAVGEQDRGRDARDPVFRPEALEAGARGRLAGAASRWPSRAAARRCAMTGRPTRWVRGGPAGDGRRSAVGEADGRADAGPRAGATDPHRDGCGLGPTPADDDAGRAGEARPGRRGRPSAAHRPTRRPRRPPRRGR